MKLLIVACLVAAAAASPRVRRDSSPDFYELPSNATTVLDAGISYGFDCAQRQFGYYADTNNNCQIFHICHPYETAEGEAVLRMYSFICGLGTIFDQSTLTCNFPEEAFPCQEAPSLYDEINGFFHREDLEFRGGPISRK